MYIETWLHLFSTILNKNLLIFKQSHCCKQYDLYVHITNTSEESPVDKLCTTEKAFGPDVEYINLVSTNFEADLRIKASETLQSEPWLSFLYIIIYKYIYNY